MNTRLVCAQLCAVGALRMAAGQGVLENIASTVQNVVKPVTDVVGGVVTNVGGTVASAIDQAGQGAASAASDAAGAVSSLQDIQISAELTSYHGEAAPVAGPGLWLPAAVGALTAALLIAPLW